MRFVEFEKGLGCCRNNFGEVALEKINAIFGSERFVIIIVWYSLWIVELEFKKIKSIKW